MTAQPNKIPTGASHRYPALSIVIVTYQSKHYMDRNLKPITSADGAHDIEIVVWDNASTDGTAEFVRERYPSVRVIASDVNLGYARANNQALKWCRGRSVLFLNPDAFIGDISDILELERLLYQTDDLAAVGPRLVNADGSHQVGDAGWATTLLSVAGHALFLHRVCKSIPSIYLTNPKLLASNSVEVDWICGACMLARRQVIDEIGGFDDQIFMYGEDVEWGERARKRGYRLNYVPSIGVLHIQGGSQRHEQLSFFSTKWMDSRALRLQQQGSRQAFVVFKLLLVVGFGLRSAIHLLRAAVTGRATARLRSANMWRYAIHAWRLLQEPKSASFDNSPNLTKRY
ncbi:glycosyltransferase family 2 protein [Geminicoccus harenae]|uniref:glycosyltransferase family 2 protein n=1 Tax=Geminicoccus harenae TaxID=2498453 RepID=UPI00168A956B|nr:glycosyltransferase family 2 protein [Geminicoccus harenae]